MGSSGVLWLNLGALREGRGLLIGAAVGRVLVKFFVDGSVTRGRAVGSVGHALVLG